MVVTLQIRNVPKTLHRRLKIRAAKAGLPMSRYLLRLVHGIAEQPTTADMSRRLARRLKVALSVSPTDAVRAERDRR
ncbi:MAG: hypothetical protein FJX11_20800 [Alphaproteobacteria bacterium]|nr:hypothetical protein [Alphaproteobacteria bacterium]